MVVALRESFGFFSVQERERLTFFFPLFFSSSNKTKLYPLFSFPLADAGLRLGDGDVSVPQPESRLGE